MSDTFPSQVSDRICKHMNEDHADAIALYAKVFGNLPQTASATMAKIDALGMDLLVDIGGETQPARIPFDPPLKDAEDAHHTLVDMLKQARSQVASQTPN